MLHLRMWPEEHSREKVARDGAEGRGSETPLSERLRTVSTRVVVR
jgi:hypothetical protein